MEMKTSVIALAVVAMLSGCKDAGLSSDQLFELRKAEAQQKHELEMKKLEVLGAKGIEETHIQSTPVAQAAESHPSLNSPQSIDSGSSVLGTVAAVGAGALAGYAVSGLLDNGYRSYTDNNGNTRYVDADRKEISRTQFEDYRRANPTQSKVSDANQKAQALVKTGQEKTVQAAQVVKEKASPYVNKVVEKTSGVVKSTSTIKPSPTVSKPAPRPTSKPSSRPSGRR